MKFQNPNLIFFNRHMDGQTGARTSQKGFFSLQFFQNWEHNEQC